MERSTLFATPVWSFTDAGDAERDRELAGRLVAESEHASGSARSPGGRADGEGVVVTLSAGPLKLRREIVGGGSYASASSHELVIGLGAQAQVDELLVRWPGGGESRLGPLAADHRYRFKFGSDTPESEDLAPPSTP